MKKIIVLILLALGFNGLAQDKKKETITASFQVFGNCEQCKDRIENAADIKGVKTSKWDEATQTLKVIYRADKVTVEKIKAAVAEAGHDVDGVKAPDNTYQKLPDCCKYRDKKCEVKK